MHDFRQLSPLDFENLVRDLLQAELGCRLESFGSGKDGGIDFRFCRAGHTTVIQAKHYVNSPPHAVIRAGKKENEKVAKLKPRRYVFVTSSTMTPLLKDQLIAAMPDAPLVRDDVLGREDLNNLLGRHPEVLRQHFKLWLTHTETLERIIHSGIYNRTEAELDVIKALIPRFVHNHSVSEAEAILSRRGALIIGGEPGVGKTTLARVLTWLHLAQGWRAFVVDDLNEALKIATTGEKRLIFFDDFLGQISLTNDVIRHADQRLPIFLDRVRSNEDLRLIVTTRSYLLSQAQMQSDRLASAKVEASELVLNVGAYTRKIRAQIVYNHIYFSDLTQEEKDSLLAGNFYLRMIDHKNFSPRLIDLLTSSDYLSIQDAPICDVVRTVLDRPTALWEVPYRSHLSEQSRIIMRAIFFLRLNPTIDDVLASFKHISRRMGLTATEQDVAHFRQGLKPLEGSIVSIQNGHVNFSNPGIRDFMTSVIIADQMLPVVVASVMTFDELDNAWSFLIINGSECKKHFKDERIWTDALERVRKGSSGSAIGHVRLALEMYSTLDSEYLTRGLANETLRVLEHAEINPSDEAECRRALEQLNHLSGDQRSELHQIDYLVHATAEMLATSGPTLSLEEITSLAEAIATCGESPLLAKEAGQSALRDVLGDFPERLREVGSTEEFLTFEGELMSALSIFKVSLSKDDTDKLHERRFMLEEMEAEQEGRATYQSTGTTGKDSDASDDEVKSLFLTLRSNDRLT